MKLRTKLIAALSACAIITVGLFAFGHIDLSPNAVLDTPFQMIYPTDNDLASFNLELTCHLTENGGESVMVILETSADYVNKMALWGFVDDWTEVARVGNSLTGTVPSGVSITNTKTTLLTHVIPAGSYVRLRTVTTGSAPVITLLSNSAEITP